MGNVSVTRFHELWTVPVQKLLLTVSGWKSRESQVQKRVCTCALLTVCVALRTSCFKSSHNYTGVYLGAGAMRVEHPVIMEGVREPV